MTRVSRAAAKHTTVAERKCTTTGAELLFEVFSQRYERGSILVTTNLPFDEWTDVFGSERLTGALHHALVSVNEFQFGETQQVVGMV